MPVIASYADLSPVPWANGAGETTELVSLTDSAVLTPELRRWRLSIARLERPGPFSSLPGLARTFLITGAEVGLTIDGREHRASPESPVRFHGEDRVELTEIAEPCCAVNLMVEDVPASTADRRPRLDLTVGPDPGALFFLTLEDGRGLSRFDFITASAAEVRQGLPGVVSLG